MAQSNGDTTNDELRDKIKFEVLVPFATYLDPMSRASLLLEEGKVVNTENVYKNAIDKIEALIKKHELDAKQAKAEKNKSICGCPMCEFHSEAYALKAEQEAL